MSFKETKNMSRLYLSALAMLAVTAVLSTVTTTGINVFAQDDSDSSNGNSDNVADNGNAGEGGNGDTQPDRVGRHDDDSQTSGEGAQGGSVSDPTIPEEELGDDGEISSNCFGKVIGHEAQEHKEEGSDEGTLGEHSRDPVPGDGDNETPRQGIGNQDQGHPAAHGAFNSQFDDDDAENVEENC
jgi:hypothetical protein